ncbi:hypothetical protein BB559_005946 [Furculomyces boomerangus]|uniref:DHHA2 domain-containing protein n=2 Tax=Harpellales TaxID=61421 RepID=A0A2T9Y5M6_9FUNG|nr:hypothetical protein BB559_005946 [Furculomyces boomerangus]PVZ96524.1 hypothetical protein BB558_007556 [Smittium angustum]
MPSFKTFLSEVLRNQLLLLPENTLSLPKCIQLVIGNESADMDSIVSSVALSYYLSLSPTPDISKNMKGKCIIPIFNIPTCDLRLRADCSYVLKNYLSLKDISQDKNTLNENKHLNIPGLFLDQIDLFKLAKKKQNNFPQLEVYLVDHNILNKKHDFLNPFIKGIVDHHFDEKMHADANIRVVEPVGSCTSLITLLLQKRLKEINTTDYQNAIPRNLCMALLAPILMDTSNLKANGKAKSADIEAANWLISLLSKYEDAEFKSEHFITNTKKKEILEEDTLKISPEELYHNLSKLKSDISQYSFLDILNKDYKQLDVKDASGNNVVLGISSIPERLQKLLTFHDVDGIKTGVDSFISELKLDLFVMMTHGTIVSPNSEKTFGREFTISFGPKITTHTREEILEKVKSSPELDLENFPQNNGNTTNSEITYFKQNCIASSRKQVSPILTSIISHLKAYKTSPL